MSAISSHQPPPPRPPFGDSDVARAALLVHLVALSSGLCARDICAPRRGDAAAARARQTAMYLAHTSFGWRLARVGAAFGRDRTTAGHACALIEDGREDARFDAMLAEIEAMLGAGSGGLLA